MTSASERWKKEWIRKYHEILNDRAFERWSDPPTIIIGGEKFETIKIVEAEASAFFPADEEEKRADQEKEADEGSSS